MSKQNENKNKTHWNKWEEYLKPFDDLKIEIKNIYYPETEYEKTIPLPSDEKKPELKKEPEHLENSSSPVDIPLAMAASILEVKEYFKPYDPLEILYSKEKIKDTSEIPLEDDDEVEADTKPKETVIVVTEGKDLEKKLNSPHSEELFGFKSLTPKELGMATLEKFENDFGYTLKKVFEDNPLVEVTFESLEVTKEALGAFEGIEKIIETTHSPIERYLEVHKQKISNIFSAKNLIPAPSQHTVLAGLSGIILGKNIEGTKTSSLKYDQGKLHGPSATYHPDGSVKEQMTYEKGLLNGVHETYDEDGNLVSSLTFKNGKLNGVGTFYKQGRKYAEFEFIDGIQQGSSSTFYETGSTMTASKYSSGKMEGDYKIFNDQGSISSVIPYKAGQKNGKTTSYYATGEVLETGTYANDLKNGSFITYYVSGNPNQISQYENGRLMDSPLYYSLKGREIDS